MEALHGCWRAVLRALATQERPGQTLGAALSARPALLDGLLRTLRHGLTHGRSGVRAASLEFWDDARVQSTLGRHLTGTMLPGLDSPHMYAPALKAFIPMPGRYRHVAHFVLTLGVHKFYGTS